MTVVEEIIGSCFNKYKLQLPRLMGVMLRLFAISPWDVSRELVLGAGPLEKPSW
jgi:hypothetical protein